MPATTFVTTPLVTDPAAVAAVPTLPKDADHLVVGIAGTTDQPRLVGVPEQVDKQARAQGSLLELALGLGADPEPGKVTRVGRFGPVVTVVGLGDDEPTPEQVRRSAGVALRTILGDARQEVHVAVALGDDQAELARAAAEGALLGGYGFVKLGSDPQRRLARLSILSGASGAKQAVADADAIARAVLVARDWVNTPANLLYPETFAQSVQALARSSRLTVEVLDDKQLAKDGYGGILAVGGGSVRKPRLVRVEHHPRGARNHLVLVGKGITFDTGGLNLKTAEGMYTMKCDMGGAAAVLAATRAIVELGLDVWVTCYAPMAENMPSGESYRPSDVVTMYGGTTVENANSDAEGRIVMADALARSREDQPDLVVDVATLTGACMVGLGLRTGGLMSSDDATADLVLDAAEAAGEDFWQLPIPAHVRKGLESKVADIKSSGIRYGGALSAGAFLQHFVGEETAWAHLDIAGPAWNDEGPYDHVPTGGTGAAVRTLVELARSLQD